MPVLLQNVITNFVSLLDNVMVGQVGTEPMSGVAIVNQLIFVFNLCIFGALAGSGIFTAQFYGKGDERGLRETTRFKLYTGLGSVIVFAVIFFFMGDSLINAFIHEGNEGLDMAATFNYGREYLHIMMIQMLPYAWTQCYSSSLREVGETVLPMKASLVAVGVNLLGNYILIFGKFGAPELGVAGAAIATVISRFVECAILMIYAHKNVHRFPLFSKLYSSFKVSAQIVKKIFRKGTPLLINELLWSAGMTMLNQCYSLKGLEVVSATNITSTITNLFFCATMSAGSTITIIVGQQLGANMIEEAIDNQKKITALSIAMCVVLGAAMALCAPLMAGIYNTTDVVKEYAVQLLIVSAILLPFNSYTNTCYFTLRTGGQTVITFLFDSVVVWCLYVPVAFVLSRFTDLEILPIYILVNCVELIKCTVGFFMCRKKTWAVNLVADEAE